MRLENHSLWQILNRLTFYKTTQKKEKPNCQAHFYSCPLPFTPFFKLKCKFQISEEKFSKFSNTNNNNNKEEEEAEEGLVDILV